MMSLRPARATQWDLSQTKAKHKIVSTLQKCFRGGGSSHIFNSQPVRAESLVCDRAWALTDRSCWTLNSLYDCSVPGVPWILHFRGISTLPCLPESLECSAIQGLARLLQAASKQHQVQSLAASHTGHKLVGQILQVTITRAYFWNGKPVFQTTS